MMRRYCLLGTCVALSALLMSCASSTPDTHDADVSALKDTEAAWVKDAATKDVEKWVAHYTDDASVLLPETPILTGKDAIRHRRQPKEGVPAVQKGSQRGGGFLHSLEDLHTLTDLRNVRVREFFNSRHAGGGTPSTCYCMVQRHSARACLAHTTRDLFRVSHPGAEQRVPTTEMVVQKGQRCADREAVQP